MKNRVLLPFLAVLFLSACVSAPRVDWVRADTTQMQKENAVAECNYQIRLNKTPVIERDELLSLCMRGKGFRLQRVG